MVHECSLKSHSGCPVFSRQLRACVLALATTPSTIARPLGSPCARSALVPPVNQRGLSLASGLAGAGHHDQLQKATGYQPWRPQLARSVHNFIKFAELCNRIPVERTAHPPLFTRHPPSHCYFPGISVELDRGPRGDDTD